MLEVVEIIALVFEVFVALIVLSNLFGKHVRISVYTGLLVIVYLFIFLAINLEDLPTYMAVLAHVAIFVYSIFEYKKSIRVSLINFLLTFVIIGVLQLVLCIPVYYLYDRINSISGLNSLLVNGASLLIVIVPESVRLIVPAHCYENKTRSQELNLDNKCFQQS